MTHPSGGLHILQAATRGQTTRDSLAGPAALSGTSPARTRSPEGTSCPLSYAMLDIPICTISSSCFSRRVLATHLPSRPGGVHREPVRAARPAHEAKVLHFPRRMRRYGVCSVCATRSQSKSLSMADNRTLDREFLPLHHCLRLRKAGSSLCIRSPTPSSATY